MCGSFCALRLLLFLLLSRVDFHLISCLYDGSSFKKINGADGVPNCSGLYVQAHDEGNFCYMQLTALRLLTGDGRIEKS